MDSTKRANLQRQLELANRLQASMSDEQRELYLEVDRIEGSAWIAEQEEMIATIARHFPGFGPAILAVADHFHEHRDGDRPPCCMEPDDER